MRRLWARWLVVIALTFSVGAHWALLQSLAWVGMTVSYAKDAPLSVAISKALDGQHPCGICKFVQEGKKSEQKGEFHHLEVKLDLVFQGQRMDLDAPVVAPLCYEVGSDWLARTLAPPLPPPRRA